MSKKIICIFDESFFFFFLFFLTIFQLSKQKKVIGGVFYLQKERE